MFYQTLEKGLYIEKYTKVIKNIWSEWNEEFELSQGSYSVTDIKDYFEYILKKHGAENDNPSMRIYVNKIENRIKFQIKTGFYVK